MERLDAEAAEKIRLAETDKEKLLVFADKLMKAKNDLIPDFFKWGSPGYPLVAECEMSVDKAIKKLIKRTEEL